MLLLLAECTPPAPQYPTQRKGQTPKADTAALALLELNRKLTLAADEQLMTIAWAQEEHYALYDCNVWMHIFDTGDELTETLREGETVTVSSSISQVLQNGRIGLAFGFSGATQVLIDNIVVTEKN